MIDFSKIVGQIGDLGKIPTKVILFFALSSGALLLFPIRWREQLRLDKLSTEYGQWVGIVFLLSSVFLAINLIGWIANKWTTARLQSKVHAKIIDAVQELDDAEKAVLREFFIQGQNTIRIPMDEPVVAGLISKGILRQVGDFGEKALAGLIFPFTLSDVARSVVTPEFIDMPMDPSDDDRRIIHALRPHFTSDIAYRERMRAGLFSHRHGS